MIAFLIGLFIGLFLGIMVMSLMKVATINDLINRNQELEEINKDLVEAIEKRTQKMNEEKRDLLNILREK